MILPELRQIRAFKAVAEHLSFTAAAYELNLTQSAISHSVKSLENLLGTTLIDRVGKSITLSQAGNLFYRRAKGILTDLEVACNEIEVLSRWGQGRLRIGATSTICHYVLPQVLSQFQNEYAHCQISIETNDTEELMAMMKQGKIDIVIGLTDTHPYPNFNNYLLFEDKLMLCMSADHTWAKLDSIPLEEISNEQIMIYSRTSTTYRIISDHFKLRDIQLKRTLALGDMHAIKEMTRLGIGASIVSPWVIERELENKELAIKDLPIPAPVRRWGLFTHKDRELMAHDHRFIELCQDICSKYHMTDKLLKSKIA